MSPTALGAVNHHHTGGFDMPLNNERISRVSVNFFRTLESWGFKAEAVEGDGDMGKPYAVRLAWPEGGFDVVTVTREAWKLSEVGFIFCVEREAVRDETGTHFVPVSLYVRHPGDLPTVYGVPYEFIDHKLSHNDNADVLSQIRRLEDLPEGMKISIDLVDWSGSVGSTQLVMRRGKLCVPRGARNPLALDTTMPRTTPIKALRIARTPS